MKRSQIRKIRKSRERRREDSTENAYRNNDIRTEYRFIAASYTKQKFYNTTEWKRLRYRALKEMGNTCMLCGAMPKFGAVIHVDHIKPRSLYPELAFDIDNLQILCKDCNEGKSNTDKTNWKKRTIPNTTTSSINSNIIRRPRYSKPVTEDESIDFVLDYLQKDKASTA